MYCWPSLTFLCYFGSILVRISADLQCNCSTDECLSEGKRTCTGKWCYSETYNGILESGCTDKWRGLLCENRLSSKLLSRSRVAHCCNDKDFCNQDIVPTLRPGSPDLTKEKKDKETHHNNNYDAHPPYLDPHADHETDSPDCPCAVNESRKSEGSMINPIYIAVPVAGVCVMLALIIFAMYLLRRRNDYYDRYQYPRTVSVPQTSANSTDNKTVTSCKLNRCTDSERSSSGSETKLFL